MASILRKVGNADNISVHQYEADTERDMWAIDVKGAPMGSRCYVIDTGAWYALNSQGLWKAVPSGGSGGLDPSNTYIYDGGSVQGG